MLLGFFFFLFSFHLAYIWSINLLYKKKSNTTLCQDISSLLSIVYKSKQFLAHLYESTGRTIALPPLLAAASGLTKYLKDFVKVLKIIYFLNPPYIGCGYSCWSKVLFILSTPLLMT